MPKAEKRKGARAGHHFASQRVAARVLSSRHEGANVQAEEAAKPRKQFALEPRGRCAKARRVSKSSPLTSVNSPGRLTPRVGSTGTISVGSTTREWPSKTCRVGAGRKSATLSMSIVSSNAFGNASKPAPPGRTRFLSGARTAPTDGFCRVLCRSATPRRSLTPQMQTRFTH